MVKYGPLISGQLLLSISIDKKFRNPFFPSFESLIPRFDIIKKMANLGKPRKI